MIIAEGRDVLRHDFHTHSLQSACGIHTVAEVLDIAAQKGVESVNVCDHGEAAGRKMNFGVLANPKRTPREVEVQAGGTRARVRLLPGIETNILDDGETDLPQSVLTTGKPAFALISGGLHGPAKALSKRKDPRANLEALRAYVERYPLDILTHPCIASFPLPIPELVELSAEHGFALEVNNTNLVVDKTDRVLLRQMIAEARGAGVTLLCNSDGHTWYELFECRAVRELVEGEMGLTMKEVFPLNFGEWDQVHERFPRIEGGCEPRSASE